MSKEPSIVPLGYFSKQVKVAADTLRKAARAGEYPSTVIGKVKGRWVVDREEWDRWHREQLH